MIPAYLLAAWTLFTWGTRIRNAVQDDEAVTSYVVPAALVALALLAVARPRRWTRLLGLSVSVAWLARVPVILLGDHEVSFVVVHVGLAVVTWLLAIWALREEARARRPAPA